MENGKYEAVSNAASVYEKDGKVLLAVEFRVGDENEMLKWYTTLFFSDGEPNTKMLKNIRGWSGWDGIDPYWLQDNAGAEWPVEATVAWEAGNKDPSKTFLNVKWVDKPGCSSGGLPDPADRASLLARFGSKFRAAAGPRAIPSGRHTPVKTAAPPARVPPPAPTRAPPGGVKHTQSSCWDALQAGQPDASPDEVIALWYSLIAERDQATMTGADWANVAEAISRLSVKSATDDGEPMPF